jgi:hypothetical protein
VADDLLDRAFAADGPDRVWVADITYLRTWEGWLYLAAVQDLYSRRIAGWAMADHVRTELVVNALEIALSHRRPAPGLIWHSDQGNDGRFVRRGPAGPGVRATRHPREGLSRRSGGRDGTARSGRLGPRRGHARPAGPPQRDGQRSESHDRRREPDERAHDRDEGEHAQNPPAGQ